jgi:hypothetical protein
VDLDEVEREQQSDPSFASRLAQAAASVEYTHVKSVKEAAQDPKNWRASVWWLEHCAAQKYAKRGPRAIRVERFENLRTAVLEAIDEELCDHGDRERLWRRLERLATGGEAEDCRQPNSDDQDETGDATI